MRKRGFTLIELLVVIAIIALLLSIITPALQQVKDRARRIMCGNALRQWGIAISAHASANNYIAKTVRRWPQPQAIPYPHYFGAVPDFDLDNVDTDYMKPEEFSVYEMAPYIDCVSKDFYETGTASPILTCPSAGGEFIVDWVYATWDEFCSPNPASPEYFIEPAYSYWVIGGMRPPLDARPVGNDGSENIFRDLTVDMLSPKRLLMSEILNIDGGDMAEALPFRYNHGRDGWCWNLWWYDDVQAPPGHTKEDGEQDATGRSQLFGDGRVEWRAISLEFEDNIPSRLVDGYLENEWNGPRSGWVNPSDISWY
jgi:prepilin-type N-terminal cleavage/methylation domain-containing protein